MELHCTLCMARMQNPTFNAEGSGKISRDPLACRRCYDAPL
jgi:hypothetical protein